MSITSLRLMELVAIRIFPPNNKLAAQAGSQLGDQLSEASVMVQMASHQEEFDAGLNNHKGKRNESARHATKFAEFEISLERVRNEK